MPLSYDNVSHLLRQHYINILLVDGDGIQGVDDVVVHIHLLGPEVWFGLVAFESVRCVTRCGVFKHSRPKFTVGDTMAEENQAFT